MTLSMTWKTQNNDYPIEGPNTEGQDTPSTCWQLSRLVHMYAASDERTRGGQRRREAGLRAVGVLYRVD